MELRRLLLLIVYIGCSASKHINITCPTEFCECSSQKAYAKCLSHGKNLTYIPKIPNYVKHVIFQGNYLPNVTKLSLWPLKYLNLSTLHLRNNEISHIATDAFQNLKNLFYLDLSGNQGLSTSELMESLSSLGHTKVAMLILNNMGWTNVPPKLFYSLHKRKIIRIDLVANQLSTVNLNDWSYLRYLSHLDISKNDIVSLKPYSFSKLTKLILNQNALNQIPNFCSRRGSYFPKLETLELTYNSIASIDSKTFVCLPKLKNLLLDKNPISRILNNTFSILPKLQVLSLKSLTRKIDMIEPLALKSASLLKFIFADNRYEFKDGTYNPKTIFKECSNITTLDLSGNNVPQDANTLVEMMKTLKHLQKITLQAVKWRYIPIKFLSLFPKLETLILSGNYISTLDNASFANITTLQHLDLSSNSLNLINKTSFPPEILSSMKHLNLAKNPFTCTCDLMWFRNWIKTVNFSLHPYPDYYKCVSPPSLKDKLLINFNPTEESCAPLSSAPVVLVTTVTSAVGAVLIVTILVMYKCRWHIRYALYLLRSKRRGYLNLINEEGFHYDGFVVYSDDDREWVHEKLLKRIEEEEEFRLCIHFRDFDVGKLIVDNIADSINASRRVCLVLSNNFAKSQWCKFELLLAQDRYLKEGTDMLVLIMLEEIEHRYITGALKTLITTTTYATWSEEQAGERLFWEQVVTAFRNPLQYNELNA